MAKRCPECRRASLKMTYEMELPADARSDEITIQIFECANCAFRGISVYQESRRGALDAESWEQSGYLVGEKAMDDLINIIKRCPNPVKKQCQCASHVRLSRTDGNGIWDAQKNFGKIVGYWDLESD
jgi:hypothetical protein